MAKPDWGELQQRFLSDHAATGVSPKDWCEAQGLNYATARRYIKKPSAQTAQKPAQKKLRTAQKSDPLKDNVQSPPSNKTGEIQPLGKECTKTRSRSGRPTDYMPEVAEDICNLLMLGESLRSICKRPGMPSIRSVMYWLQRHEDFMQQYARAREIQAELLAEEIIEIADDSAGDIIVDDDGKEQTNHERVARSRLRVDARKWYVSKLAPKRYGERVQHDQKITITDLTDEELDRRLQELTDAQSQPGGES